MWSAKARALLGTISARLAVRGQSFRIASHHGLAAPVMGSADASDAVRKSARRVGGAFWQGIESSLALRPHRIQLPEQFAEKFETVRWRIPELPLGCELIPA